MSDQTQYLTEEGYKKIQQELEHLKKVRRPQIAERIKLAKDYGDLSENAEYADAREEQSFSEGRILELEYIMKNAEIVSSEKSDPSVVQIGDKVTVEKDGEKSDYIIVGSNEASPSEGRISNQSPIGKSLLGKRKGEQAVVKTPKGEKNWKIIDIKPAGI
ncbi:MAG: transcription elongation factor GreA [Parcubacteria group bacterium CG_4_9_14_0_2_um_filter_41_8]|nr:MAG: transcription elongation factor GreA [Parcubacteria group bacterium CG1_02_41_12]PIP67320.1 MAG: transcription elongation factor GreA [Parcubacteria group bacterium CG22_combo_CG10-13_8_21_14_all_41_9]PIZ81335.1 MAG: transcription elongation factor GreA [Parcubacteria group bacterium CG_4_10_14_0_2_um_filter_41_6]PJC40873.1 MAG: transcription elongation factor GreA [Parcubacteria group bacterium CG_4_9_14_0_2_um_filter_41_8]